MTIGLRDFVPELARQPLLFRETFRTRAATLANGATLVGTGTSWPAGGGVTFDGNGNLLYAVAGQQILTAVATFVIEFTPGFALGDGVEHYFFELDNGAGANRTLVRKDAAGNVGVYSGATTGLLAVAPGVAWLELQRNRLVISVASGAISAWLNGTLIGSAAVAFTYQTSLTRLALGARCTGVSRFIGTIHRIEIYGSVSTAVDEPLLRQGNLVESVSFDNALSYLRGRNYYRRAGDGLYVTDVGGKGTVTQALMGSDGSTVAQFPGIIRPNGFSFDGGDQINLGDADQFSFTNGVSDAPFSVAMLANVTDYTAIRILLSKRLDNNTAEWMISTSVGGAYTFALYDQLVANYRYRYTANNVVARGMLVPLVFTFGGGNIGATGRIYQSGVRVDTLSTSGGVYNCMKSTISPVKVGILGASYPMLGSIGLLSIWDFELSPLQVRALSARMIWEARRA